MWSCRKRENLLNFKNSRFDKESFVYGSGHEKRGVAFFCVFERNE